jgi:hypothetical protein
MYKKHLFLASVCFGLAGCFGPVTPPSTPSDRCSTYGYSTASTKFKDCVADETRNDRLMQQQSNDARRARALSNLQKSDYCQWSSYC